MDRTRSKILTVALLAGSLLLAGCEGDDGRNGATGATGPAGAAGAEGAAGAAGAAGADGADGADGGGVTVAHDRIIGAANDLRGITYARVGDHANKIYVSGHVGTTNETRQVVVGRLFADGTADTSFAGDGYLELEATEEEGGNDENALGIAELQSGDVIAVTRAVDASGGESVYLFRVTPDGARAAGWGDAQGKVEVVFGNANADDGAFPGAPVDAPADLAWDIRVDHSVETDRVVVFGIGSAGDGIRTDRDRYVTRLDITAAGATLDPDFNGGAPFAFGSGGTLAEPGVLTDNARRGMVEADGSIVSAGYADPAGDIDEHVVLIKLTADGELDANFGGFTDDETILAATPGIAIFNPFIVDEGFAESYAVGKQSSGSYVTIGYGGATRNDGTASTLGYETTVRQDVVAFRVVDGPQVSHDLTFGNGGHLVIQSEGHGFPSARARGRHMEVLHDDRILVAGMFGGSAGVFVLTEQGALDSTVAGNGILELRNDTVTSQFFGLAQSADGSRVALTTNSNDNGARIVILKIAP